MNKAEQFHEALSEHWNKENGLDDFQETFEPQQDNMMHDKPGELIAYSADVMIMDREMELLIRFCKRTGVRFSISPPLTFTFHIDNFKS